MKMTKILVILLTVLLICVCNGYKILVLSPVPGKSHAILGDAIVRHLVEAGHEVTYITGVIPDKPLPRVNIIDVSDNKKLIISNDFLNISKILDKSVEMDITKFIPMYMNLTRNTITNPAVQNLLNDKSQKFDLAVLGWMFTDIFAGFAAVFNCPYAWFSTVEPHWKVLQLIDEIPNPAYSVDIFSYNVPPLNFGQRVMELGMQIIGKVLEIFVINGYEYEMYENLFVPHIHSRGLPVPPLDVIRYNASLVLSNSHVSMGIVNRSPPNFIPIGGYHIDTEVKPLPTDLQTLMDNAKHGVIYFSMGSNFRSQYFPDHLKKEILAVFGALKETVLWKFEEDLPNRPSNVHIVQWAPQPSILAHKNCVLFITHGGLLSTTETIHFGVPVIGIPIGGDQFVNVARGVQKGFAKQVDLSFDLAKDLKIAIQDMLSNPTYTHRAKELSMIYHDRPFPPSKELVHWVEHVVKTGGAPHLRHPALLMPWYQKIYLDLILVVVTIVVVLKYLCKFIYSLLHNVKTSNSIKKKAD